jgi:hypothetical protein
VPVIDALLGLAGVLVGAGVATWTQTRLDARRRADTRLEQIRAAQITVASSWASFSAASALVASMAAAHRPTDDTEWRWLAGFERFSASLAAMQVSPLDDDGLTIVERAEELLMDVVGRGKWSVVPPTSEMVELQQCVDDLSSHVRRILIAG